MTTSADQAERKVALRYTGDRSQLDTAEQQLIAAVPANVLIRRASGLFEFSVPDEQALALKLPEGWLVYEPTYADFSPPGVSLVGLQKKLAELRSKHN